MHAEEQVVETVDILKRLVKQKGHTYADLARYLNLSLPAVKRAMTANEMPLSRVYAICSFLRVELLDILHQHSSQRVGLFNFTTEQEEFFATHPNYLAYLFELKAGRSVKETELKAGISPKSTRSYLKKLQEMKLLSFDSKLQVTLHMKGIIYWSDHGILGRAYSLQFLKSFTKYAVAKFSEPKKMFMRTHGWLLTEENYSELQREYLELEAKYRQLSSYNKKILPPGDYAKYSIMTLADEWYEVPYRKVTEL